jgi:integrase
VDTRVGIVRVRGQLDRQGRQFVPATKTSASRRDVALTPELARLLREHKAQAFEKGLAAADAFVFSTETGTPLHHRNLSRRALEPALEASGLPPLRWHDLRHLAASAMFEKGMELRDVSAVLGHADVTVTARTYAHAIDRQARNERIRGGIAVAFGELLR